MIRKIVLIIVCLIMTNLSFSQSEEVRKDVSIHNDSIGWKKSLSNNNVIIRLGFRNIFFWGCWSFMNKIEFLYPYNSKLRLGLYGYHTAPDILYAYQVDKKTVYSISTTLYTSFFSFIPPIPSAPYFESKTRYTHYAGGVTGEYLLVDKWKIFNKKRDNNKSNSLYISFSIGLAKGFVSGKKVARILYSGAVFVGAFLDEYYEVFEHTSIETSVSVRIMRNNNKRICWGCSYFVTYIPLIYQNKGYFMGWLFEINGIFSVKKPMENVLKKNKNE